MIISILDTIKNGDISGGAIGWIAFFIITIGGIFFEISPIKLNPVSWLGAQLFKPVNTKIDSLQKSIDKVISQSRPKGSTVKNNDSVTIVVGKKSTTVVDTPPTPKEKETEEKTNTEEKTDNNPNKETE